MKDKEVTMWTISNTHRLNFHTSARRMNRTKLKCNATTRNIYPVEEHGHGDDAGGLGELQALQNLLSAGHDRTGGTCFCYSFEEIEEKDQEDKGVRQDREEKQKKCRIGC